MRIGKWWAALGLALAMVPGLAWADFEGRVVRVSDGDTVNVLRELADGSKEQVRVRLASIDAPERRQAFGTRSSQLLAELVFDRNVLVEEQGRDRYGRVIGVLHVDGTNANQQMVRAGLAWAYRQYLNDSTMVRLETGARRARRGLWADADAVAPWEFRRAQSERQKAQRQARAAAAAAVP